MIKVIFFDFDGVLTTDASGSYTTCTNIRRELPDDISFNHIMRCYRNHHYELLLGNIVHGDIWQDFCRCVGKDLDISVLLNAFRDTPINHQMMNVCKSLKTNYPLGIITDNSKDRFEVVKTAMKLPMLFDYFIVSGDLGSRKDCDANFDEAMRVAGVRAEECVFIDNNMSNLRIPSRLGFTTIHHDDKSNDVVQLVQHMRDSGVKMDL